MKNFLKKLHIGDSPQPVPRKSAASGISSWLNSVTNRQAHHPMTTSDGAGATSAPEEEEEEEVVEEVKEEEEMVRKRREEEEMVRKRMEEEEVEEKERKEEEELEEYQIQLALEMSAREDPEAVQIEVAKQISLGSCHPQSSPAEIVAYRYWNFKALSYDDKILDGFYDLFGFLNEPTSVPMPSLVDLQEKPFADTFGYEAVLVNRAEDAELLKLEEKAFIMAVEVRSRTSESVGSVLVQRLAFLVADKMGGPVSDPENMAMSYQNMRGCLRASTGNIVLALGHMTIGLARHRALLFKVLADSLSIPCRLVKGRQYTGSDDGALNIVKFNDGREYIVDLMADPGTLIPSDGAGFVKEFEESFFAENHFSKDANIINLGSPSSEVTSSACWSFENELVERRSMSSNVGLSDTGAARSSLDHQGDLDSSSPSKLSTSTSTLEDVTIINVPRNIGNGTKPKPQEKSTSNHTLARSTSAERGGGPSVRKMKVKDVSEYMINAAKDNPELAQKLHDVLLDSGVVAPPDLFSDLSAEQPKDIIVYNPALFANKDEMKKAAHERASKDRADGGHGPMLTHRPGHEIHPKVLPSRAPLEALKPVEGLGLYHPAGQGDNVHSSSSESKASGAPVQENPLQLIKQMPVAAAVATAAVVASSMVVAAAKSNSDVSFEVPVAAAATVTAAAVVATTAAVSKQHEHMDSSNPLLNNSGPFEGAESSQRARNDLWDKQHLESDHGHVNGFEQDKDVTEAPQVVDMSSDKSTGTESAKSDIALDDVAEFEIQWEEITLGERIGLGSFGEVYKGEWHGTEVAVKKFLHQHIPSDALEEFMTEVRIMKRLRHPNVVLFMGAVTRVPNLSIVTEFLPRGSLFRLIHRPNNQLDERKRLRMALDVARGMNYLHNCTPIIVHRDLKSPNLLVDKNWVVKVCDFGLSRMKHNTFLSSRSTAGTAEWMAPEVLRNEPSDERCDIFSFGVILWELCTFQQPWEGMNPMQVVGAVGFQHRRLAIPDDMDPIIADIIEKCWQTDPKLRPSFSEIMAALKPLLKNMPYNQVARQRVPIGDDPERGDS